MCGSSIKMGDLGFIKDGNFPTPIVGCDYVTCSSIAGHSVTKTFFGYLVTLNVCNNHRLKLKKEYHDQIKDWGEMVILICKGCMQPYTINPKVVELGTEESYYCPKHKQSLGV